MDYTESWYHGSPFELRSIRKGSTITQKRGLARIFSHKPTIVSVEHDGAIRHNGKAPGYLYLIAETIGPEDVTPHPRTTMGPGDEWLITRELPVQFLEATEPRTEELLTEKDIAELRMRQKGS